MWICVCITQAHTHTKHTCKLAITYTCTLIRVYIRTRSHTHIQSPGRLFYMEWGKYGRSEIFPTASLRNGILSNNKYSTNSLKAADMPTQQRTFLFFFCKSLEYLTRTASSYSPRLSLNSRFWVQPRLHMQEIVSPEPRMPRLSQPHTAATPNAFAMGRVALESPSHGSARVLS